MILTFFILVHYKNKEIIFLICSIKMMSLLLDETNKTEETQESLTMEEDRDSVKMGQNSPARTYLSLQLKSLQNEPLTPTKVNTLTLTESHTNESRPPSSRKRYHTAPRDKNRVSYKQM